jgi:hypothetical protein
MNSLASWARGQSAWQRSSAAISLAMRLLLRWSAGTNHAAEVLSIGAVPPGQRRCCGRASRSSCGPQPSPQPEGHLLLLPAVNCRAQCSRNGAPSLFNGLPCNTAPSCSLVASGNVFWFDLYDRTRECTGASTRKFPDKAVWSAALNRRSVSTQAHARAEAQQQQQQQLHTSPGTGDASPPAHHQLEEGAFHERADALLDAVQARLEVP